MKILECKDLCVSYDGKHVLENVNFSLAAGDYLCVVGENGSGKSTLIKALLGLKAPDSGSVSFGEGLKSSQIGYLPQQTQIQRDFPASVEEVVLSGCINSMGRRAHYGPKQRELAEMNIERMSIDSIKKTCYHELSGGQQQRVLLARALCATGRMLLLDEPVTGLDPIAAEEMYNLIKLVNLCDRITVIMVSHDIKAALRYATHILHLGRDSSFFGTVQDYKQSDVARRFLR